MIKEVSMVVMAVLYVIAGSLHFLKPRMYLGIMPPHIPYPHAVVFLSGIAEMVCGLLLLIPTGRVYGAWAIIVLLIAIFPANIYMSQQGGAKYGTKNWILLARLPLQLVLIAWAYWYT